MTQNVEEIPSSILKVISSFYWAFTVGQIPYSVFKLTFSWAKYPHYLFL